MKVLMFGWEFPPHISGGLGTACLGLTKGLAKQDVQIKFVVPKAYGDEDTTHIKLFDAKHIITHTQNKRLEEYWKNVVFIEMASGITPYVSPEEYEKKTTSTFKHTAENIDKVVTSMGFQLSGGYGQHLYSEVFKYSQLATIIASDQDFDIIHAHDWLTYPAGIAAKQVSGKPLVVHMHATEFDRSGESVNQYVYDIERQGMEMADMVIAVSEKTRQTVITRYGIDPEKVKTIHNGVEFAEATPSAMPTKAVKEKVVTFLGRITYQKGPDYFVEAAYKVLQKTDNVRFVMAGSGDMLNKMIKRVAKLGISTKFHFTGFLKGDDVHKMLSMTDVYVMPSVSEPFGISPLEAIQSGVPVIISKQSGVSEILENAIKVDFWDTNALSDAMYGLLNYQPLNRIFKHRGKKEVEQINWNNAALKIKETYESLLS